MLPSYCDHDWLIGCCHHMPIAGLYHCTAASVSITCALSAQTNPRVCSGRRGPKLMWSRPARGSPRICSVAEERPEQVLNFPAYYEHVSIICAHYSGRLNGHNDGKRGSCATPHHPLHPGSLRPCRLGISKGYCDWHLIPLCTNSA